MKRIFMIMTIGVLAVLVAGAAFAASVMDRDVIRVGTESTFKPFEYRDESNNIVGFDIDLINAVAKRLDKDVEIVDMSFDGLIPSLLTGKIDLIAAGMTIKPARLKKVDFSTVYYHAENAFVTRMDDERLGKLGDLKGKVVSVQMGTVQDSFITENGDVAEVKRFKKNDDALREVLLGRADVAILDKNVANSYIRNAKDFQGKLRIAFRNFINRPEEGVALAMPKGDSLFVDAVNAALAELEESGELLKMKEKYGID